MGCGQSVAVQRPSVRTASELDAPPKKPTICGSLVYDDVAHGTLQLWFTTDAPVNGALVYFETEAKVPDFKLTQNCGRSEIMRGLNGPNSQKYYEAWGQFLKTAKGFGGSVTHVANKDAKPVAIYITDPSIKVSRIHIGKPFDLSEATSVAIVPVASAAYKGVASLSASMFRQNAINGGGTALDLR